MVNMEISPLLLVPEEEEPLERPDVENKLTRSLSCFGCCFGKPEDGREKWWMNGGLSQSIKRAKEYSGSVIVEAGNYCCGGKTWKTVVHRLRNKDNGRSKKRGQRFQYDLPSYELNFDDGSKEEMGLP
ncbi:hypothetical protein SUGI_0574170 [Cryptomeria japonica]|uniref:uncharacterized protein LOC131034654 n=1 Tax=Cryptomeria japonica TaxID=3369 RepID=UPI002408F0AE|nr:uncharacterized protein LOC131034654 [Cryptomeria japonica]GLJ29125.1 hypothetical protein SUGI_0574170 [Cryptomeria japonica]